jgi:hypothetical protein
MPPQRAVVLLLLFACYRGALAVPPCVISVEGFISADACEAAPQQAAVVSWRGLHEAPYDPVDKYGGLPMLYASARGPGAGSSSNGAKNACQQKDQHRHQSVGSNQNMLIQAVLMCFAEYTESLQVRRVVLVNFTTSGSLDPGWPLLWPRELALYPPGPGSRLEMADVRILVSKSDLLQYIQTLTGPDSDTYTVRRSPTLWSMACLTGFSKSLMDCS